MGMAGHVQHGPEGPAALPPAPATIFSSPMPRLLTPKFLLRGFEISVLASMAGFGITLLYGNDFPAFLRGLGRVHLGLGRWPGACLASMDWIGGGLRLWICARHVFPRPSLKGCILAGGMGAWAGFSPRSTRAPAR